MHRPIVDDNCNLFWYKGDKLHRLDGPAVEYTNGDKFWYKEGLYHRLDGPAFELSNGIKQYWMNGERYFPLFLQFDKIIEKIKKYGK